MKKWKNEKKLEVPSPRRKVDYSGIGSAFKDGSDKERIAKEELSVHILRLIGLFLGGKFEEERPNDTPSSILRTMKKARGEIRE